LPDGTFNLGGFLPRSYKFLTLVSSPGLEEWYSDKTSYAMADAIPISAGQTTTADIYLGDSGTLTLTAPNGGETLNVGQSFAVSWSSSGTLGNVKLEYSTNGGTGWTTIAASTENDGSYSWTVPDSPSTNCLVRVSETDGSPSDTSNAAFTIAIVAPPSANRLAVDFGTLGLWTWDNYVWAQLTGANADGLVAADTDGDLVDEIVVDFGMFGAWLADGAAWTQLSGVNADGLIAADTDGDGADGIVGDFGSIGLWLWNAGAWSQASGLNPASLISGDFDGDNQDEIVGDFGTTGLFLWNSGSWTQIL